MFRHSSLLLVCPLIVVLGIFYLTTDDGSSSTETINAVIGDESYIHIFGEKPGPDIPDRVRIQTHLDYVSDVLRNRPVDHLTEKQKQNRKKYLNLLDDYISAGEFPHNDGHPDKRRPTFISEGGHICAVGYLVKQTAGTGIAETINMDFKFAFIPGINHPRFLEWADQSGFSIDELAMIQPMYGTIVTEEEKINKRNPGGSFGFGSAILGSVNALYLSSPSAEPLIFSSPARNHWFGLAAGSASILLGSRNLSNTKEYTTPDVFVCRGTCTITEVTETNHARTVIAAANIGVGLVSVARAGYRLISGTDERAQTPSGLSVTQIVAEPLENAEVVPALTYTVRF